MKTRALALFRMTLIVCCFILAGGVLSRIARAEEAPGITRAKSLRVMTFNIRYNTPKDGANAWPRRKDLAASMIRFHRADVAGLQEALIGQLRDLEKLLPGYTWLGAGRDDGKEAGEHSAILYRKDRLEPLRHATFWFSDTPDEASQGWDNNRRVTTWCEFRDRASGKSFFMFNTHLGFTKEHRQKSIPLLRKRINTIAGDAPVVLTGDFNMLPNSAQYQALTAPFETDSRTLRDAFTITETPRHGPSGTWSGFEKAGEPGRRIDFVFVNRLLRVLRHGTLSDSFDGRFPSDHLPVLAEVVLR